MPDQTAQPLQPANILTAEVASLRSQTSPLVLILLTAILTVLLCDRFLKPATPSQPAPPSPAVDPHFVAIGKAYLPGISKAYADAWEDGAKGLDSGKPYSVVLEDVAKSWDASRTALFGKSAVPEFNKIIAATVKDADVTLQQRAAMAAAFRGFAAGLGK